jgi:pyruvate dehydrogenase E2 component (dihydrolipoamide acetyltransferase)
MAEIVTMPKLGFDMAEGTLVRWIIQEGEPVKKGAVLAEIETDKATVEVESAYDGIISKHLVPAGEIVPVSTPIAIVSAPGESPESIAATMPQAARTSAAPTAATPEPANQPTMQAAAPAPVEEGRLPSGVKASPLARRMAAEMRINLKAVRGTGPGGRITKRDVQAYLAAPIATAAPAISATHAAAPSAAPPPAASKPAPALVPLAPMAYVPAPADEIVHLNRLRAAIGRRMVEAKQQVPHFYVAHEYDVATLLDLRKQVNALLPDEEKVSVNDFIIKATALALRQFPNLNASLQGDQIVRHGSVNIGVAVAVEGGLLTVVCRDADRKPLRQIAVEVRTMAARAREGKVRPEDIEGSTFSISNLGMFDVEQFTAIINPPEAAILAVSSAREIPVVKDGQIQPGWRMKATISVDHRVSDGAEAARFMQSLTAYIEQPLRLLV